MSHEGEAEGMSASTARQSLVRAAQDGERRWFFGGGVHIWKATSDDTGGAFLLFEDRMDHGKVTPLHLHPDSDETMIVLEGEILMHLDGVQHTVRAGGIASAPRGIPHAFKGLRRWRRPAAVPAHTRLLPGVLLGRQRARRGQ
jgi:quercetin dioxygenase-like cupin family protein